MRADVFDGCQVGGAVVGVYRGDVLKVTGKICDVSIHTSSIQSFAPPSTKPKDNQNQKVSDWNPSYLIKISDICGICKAHQEI